MRVRPHGSSEDDAFRGIRGQWYEAVANVLCEISLETGRHRTALLRCQDEGAENRIVRSRHTIVLSPRIVEHLARQYCAEACCGGNALERLQVVGKTTLRMPCKSCGGRAMYGVARMTCATRR